ncbi:hypothetical protein ACOSP7_020677 [Xanthoceras sorbifolium]
MAGWYKLNTDASLKNVESLVGLGAVIRDDNGLFMVGLSCKLVGSVLIEVVEASAILNGPQLVIESRFSHLLVESDALNIITYFVQEKPHNSEVGLVVADILSLCNRAIVSFAFVTRCANSVAHSLARNSFSIDNVSIWPDDASPWLNQGLLFDLQF